MKGYIYLIAKEIKMLFKDKNFYIWVLFLPLIFLFVFSKMGTGGTKQKIFVKDNAGNSLSISFIQKLSGDFKIVGDKKNIPVVEISEEFNFDEKGKTNVKVVLPQNFSKEKEIYLKIAIYRALAEVFADKKLNIENPLCFMALKKEKDKLLGIPWGIRHFLPAVVLMFILFNVLTKGIEKFYQYEESGLIQRFAVAPSGYKGLVLFFLFYPVILALLSVFIIFLFGIFIFGFKTTFYSGVVLFLVFILFAIFSSSLSLLLFSIFKKKEAAVGMGIMLANILCALGGLWWPLEIAPPFFRKLGLILPTGFTMKLIDKIIYYNLPLSSVVWGFAVLGIVSFAFVSLSLLVFARKSH